MAYRVLVWGLGAMGSGIAKNVLRKKELQLVGAIERDPSKIDRDLGEVLGLERSGRRVYSEPEKAILETRPDIVLIATNSFVNEVMPKIELAAKNNVNVLTIAEEMAYPYESNPEQSKIWKTSLVNTESQYLERELILVSF